MQELLQIPQKEKNRGPEKQKEYSCEKKTYDQYVEIFKENNPCMLKSIMEHQNDISLGDSKEIKNDCTQENIILNKDNKNIVYSFNYEINLNWNDRVGAGAIHIADTSTIWIFTVLISQEYKQREYQRHINLNIIVFLCRVFLKYLLM